MNLEYSYEKNKFIFQCSYFEKDIPKDFGFRWDPKEKHWWTSDVSIAKKAENYADAKCLSEIKNKINELEWSFNASTASSSDFKVPCPDGIDFMPFQKAGIEYASLRPNTLIGDDMGLGKTVQAIGVSNCDKSIDTVLIICPAAVKINWS